MGEHLLPRAVRMIPGYTGALGQIIRDQAKPREPVIPFTSEAEAERAIRRLTKWTVRHAKPVIPGTATITFMGMGRRRAVVEQSVTAPTPPRHVIENAELARHYLAARKRA